MTRAKPVPETVTVHIPFRLVKRGGRKEMHMPDGASSQRSMDNTLVKALARAFRWKRMLESGEFTSISELAEKEGIAFTYMARLLRLALLSPKIVDSILSGNHSPAVTLAKLMDPFPLDWDQQFSCGFPAIRMRGMCSAIYAASRPFAQYFQTSAALVMETLFRACADPELPLQILSKLGSALFAHLEFKPRYVHLNSPRGPLPTRRAFVFGLRLDCRCRW